jgi:hypothetical protein
MMPVPLSTRRGDDASADWIIVAAHCMTSPLNDSGAMPFREAATWLRTSSMAPRAADCTTARATVGCRAASCSMTASTRGKERRRDAFVSEAAAGSTTASLAGCHMEFVNAELRPADCMRGFSRRWRKSKRACSARKLLKAIPDRDENQSHNSENPRLFRVA